MKNGNKWPLTDSQGPAADLLRTVRPANIGMLTFIQYFEVDNFPPPSRIKNAHWICSPDGNLGPVDRMLAREELELLGNANGGGRHQKHA